MKKKYFLAFALLFMGSLVCGSEAQGALTSDQCKASGQGAYCHYSSFGGNVCDDESWVSDTNYEKDLGVCDAPGAVSHTLL